MEFAWLDEFLHARVPRAKVAADSDTAIGRYTWPWRSNVLEHDFLVPNLCFFLNINFDSNVRGSKFRYFYGNVNTTLVFGIWLKSVVVSGTLTICWCIYWQHGDEDRSHESKDGDYQPPAKDREYRAPRDQEREYRAPRDQDREYRAPRDQEREYRAPRDQDREYRAPRDQDRDYRPPRSNDYRAPRGDHERGDYRAPRGDNERGDYRASRETYRDHRPPARDQERDYQPPRSNDRDDHRENGHYRGGNRGAGGNSRAPPQRANDRCVSASTDGAGDAVEHLMPFGNISAEWNLTLALSWGWWVTDKRVKYLWLLAA